MTVKLRLAISKDAFLMDLGNRYTLIAYNTECGWETSSSHLWQTGSPRAEYHGDLWYNPNTGHLQGALADKFLHIDVPMSQEDEALTLEEFVDKYADVIHSAALRQYEAELEELASSPWEFAYISNNSVGVRRKTGNLYELQDVPLHRVALHSHKSGDIHITGVRSYRKVSQFQKLNKVVGIFDIFTTAKFNSVGYSKVGDVDVVSGVVPSTMYTRADQWDSIEAFKAWLSKAYVSGAPLQKVSTEAHFSLAYEYEAMQIEAVERNGKVYYITESGELIHKEDYVSAVVSALKRARVPELRTGSRVRL